MKTLGAINSIKYETVLVTPAIARQWLGKNWESNRLPKRSKIPNYARDMANGRWRTDTGETIKFTSEDPSSNTLVDGQNRLSAVIMAPTIKRDDGTYMSENFGIWFDVAYNVPFEAVPVIDTGSSRTFADAMIIGGTTTERFRAAAIVRWAMQWEKGQYTGHAGGATSPTHAEMFEVYSINPEAFDAAALRGRDCATQGIGMARAMGMAYLLFQRIDKEQATQFFDLVVTGANLPEGHPVLTLRTRLQRAKLSTGRELRSGRLNQAEQLAAVIRAWNAFRERRTMDMIIIAKSGKLTNDNFPQPR